MELLTLRQNKIAALQNRRDQIHAYLTEDAEDSLFHGWTPPDHRSYFVELEEIDRELRRLGVG